MGGDRLGGGVPLYLVVLRYWAASRASYGFVIIPFVTLLLSVWVDNERARVGLALGGLLILTLLRIPWVDRPIDSDDACMGKAEAGSHDMAGARQRRRQGLYSLDHQVRLVMKVWPTYPRKSPSPSSRSPQSRREWGTDFV
jgi:hypothetical protein